MLGDSATGCGCGGLSDLGLNSLQATGYRNAPYNPSQTYGSLQGTYGSLQGGASTASSAGIGVLIAIGLIAWAATGFKGL